MKFFIALNFHISLASNFTAELACKCNVVSDYLHRKKSKVNNVDYVRFVGTYNWNKSQNHWRFLEEFYWIQSTLHLESREGRHRNTAQRALLCWEDWRVIFNSSCLIHKSTWPNNKDLLKSIIMTIIQIMYFVSFHDFFTLQKYTVYFR